MSHVVFAWQLGSNYGHLTTDLPIAECLREQGHEVSFIVPDSCVAVATEILSPARFSFARAPALHGAPAASGASASYAEIMIATGFGDERALDSLAEQWSGLLQSARADVVVADHAPMAVLCARLSGIPAALIGNGFTIPPLLDSMPSIRPWEEVPASRLRRSEDIVLRRTNAIAARRPISGAALERVSQLFAQAPALITTTRELDPYGPREQGVYIGPVAAESPSEPVAWRAGGGRRVFAYLRPTMSRIAEILTSLEECSAQVICAMPGATIELQRHFSDTGVNLIGRAVPLSPLLADADAVVSYGGSGLISSALLAGVPLLLVPQNPEQYLGSLQVAKLGAAAVIDPRSQAPMVAQLLERMLASTQHREAAQRYADAHRAHDRREAARLAASIIAQRAVAPR
jgi:UDP:flavonoid glycosyltransferase YjiC (YdhE family)